MLAAAHPVREGARRQTSIAAEPQAVAERVVYPDFKMPRTDGLSGDPASLTAQLAAMRDIALTKLAGRIDKACRDAGT